MTENFYNEFDTIHFGVPLDMCDLNENTPLWDSVLGAEYRITPSYVNFNISSKLFATSNWLGAITFTNMEEIPTILNQKFNFNINPQYLLEKVPLRRADVKKDFLTKELPNYYIYDLRRYLKRATKKYNVDNHDELIYSNGFSVNGKHKYSHRFSVYNKGVEISLAKNKELREKFEYEYLKKLDKTLRCEVQFTGYKEIKTAFHIPFDKVQTFKSVLSCPYDVVCECFTKLMKGEKAL